MVLWKNFGFTILELMVALGLSTILVLMVATQMATIKKTELDIQNLISAERDFTELYQYLNKLTYRSRDMGTSYFTSTTTGYLISEQGALGFLADLTSCANFNPSIPVLSPVVILCCAKNLSTATGFFDSKTNAAGFSVPTVPVPVGGYTSACTGTTGLSIQTGSAKVCYPYVSSLNLMKVGYHETFGTDLLLLNLKSNFAAYGKASVPVRGLSMFFGLGNSPGSSVIFCDQHLGL